MKRRMFLSVVGAAVATGGFAEGQPPAAASLAKATDPVRDVAGLFIAGEDGGQISPAEYAGRLIVLNLWGPWCQPCRREMPSLSRLAESVDPARIAVLPLAFDWRGPVWIQKFYRETEISNLPVLLGDGQNLLNTLGLQDLPSTAIIDQTGRHIFTVAGEARWDDPATLGWLTDLAA